MSESSQNRIDKSSSLPFIRAVAYHHCDPAMVPAFRRQLEFFRRHYRNVTEQELDAFFAGAAAEDQSGKPGLILSFDDGLARHYQTVAPLVEEYGFRAWFFVPAALPSLPAERQRAFCEAQALWLSPDPGERIGMSGAELADLRRRGHVIGCHTFNHRRFRGVADAALLDSELAAAQAALASFLGAAPRSFAWVGGEADTYHPLVQENLAKLGFSYAFTTMSAPIRRNADPLLLHRSVLDADMPYALFRAKLGGLSDWTHRSGRKALEARLGRKNAPESAASGAE